MRLFLKRCACLFMLAGLCAPHVLAKPDIFFADSDAYDGAYLRHELEGDLVKFVVTKPVAGIVLPDEFFDFDELTNYIKSEYEFPSAQMKAEFKDMMRMSFNSSFKAREFLEELSRVLASFSMRD